MSTVHPIQNNRAAVPASYSRRIVERGLESLRIGGLEVEFPDGEVAFYGDPAAVPQASLRVLDESFFRDLVMRGDIGLAQSYLRGAWTSPDIAALIELGARNRMALAEVSSGRWWMKAFYRLRHALRFNSRAGSARNIRAHYDLGNEFYGAWLDPGMNYSSGLYTPDAVSLELAQREKHDRILDEIGARPGMRILEIGCGWGAFAERAARRGAEVHAITVSPAQHRHTVGRMRRIGVDDRVTTVLLDYRDIDGSYDAIVSIEMFEAVGERYWPEYFEILHRALKPGGRAVVQTITIADALFEEYRSGTDFIREMVFPGGMLPSNERFTEAAEKAGFRLDGSFGFGASYARTLQDWRSRFEMAWPVVRKLGFDRAFRRLWRLYLAYCEGGFRAGSIDVVQFTLSRD